MARFVLVHGAFGGAWCWEPVIGPVEAAGPHGRRARPARRRCRRDSGRRTLRSRACARRVCEVLANSARAGDSRRPQHGRQSSSPRLRRTAPEHVASLIFVAAFMPANGQSLLDLTHLPEGEGDLIQANIVIEGEPPVAVLSADATAAAVYNDCTSEQTAWAVARRRPQAVAPYVTPVERGRGRAGRDSPLVRADDPRPLSHARAPTPDDPRAPVRAGHRARRRPRAVSLGDGRARRGASRAGRRARRVCAQDPCLRRLRPSCASPRGTSCARPPSTAPG